MVEYNRTFGKRIKELRELKKYTLDQLAKKVGMSRQNLYFHEQDGVVRPKRGLVNNIARELECDYKDLTNLIIKGIESYYEGKDNC